MKLCIPLKVWLQMRAYCLAASPNEVTGIGTIDQIDGNLVVNQVYIPHQSASAEYCISDKGALNEIVYDVIKDDPSRASSIRFRWHSHAKSSVFWSQADEDDIDSWQGPWVVNLVMNIYDDYLARLDRFCDARSRNIPLELKLLMPIPDKIMEHCHDEVKAKVKPLILPLKPGLLKKHKTATLSKANNLHESK